MKLTTFTDYTLRTLMYLAVHDTPPATIADDAPPATITDIARAYRISEAHVMKVVHQLGVAGDIETIRGRNGGIRLARPPDAINIGAVVRRTEAGMELVPCFGDDASCVIGDACLLRGVLDEALAAFLAVLDRFTLADLVLPRRRLTMLLGLPADGRPEDAP